MLFPTPFTTNNAKGTAFPFSTMCKQPKMCPSKSPSKDSFSKMIQASPPSKHLRQLSLILPSFIRNFPLIQPPYTKKKIFLLILLTCFLTSILLFASFYTFHRGFRRTIQFWRGMGPLILKYKAMKFKANQIEHVSPEELERRLTIYRENTAPKLVDLILRMGGIYVKIGQVMSTIGQGLLPDEYIKALQPLQDGVPPRDYQQISQIIQQSSGGKRMEDIFLEFEETPIGAASIAQAHRATLKPPTNPNNSHNNQTPEKVIVKVQYPEVAELFEADLSNLELATRLFAPENIEVAKALRKRHENELDFRMEANNLRECTRDMQSLGMEPNLVRIPRVKNETGICSQNVLVMEYLEGMSLSDAIQEEQDRVARALGKEDGEELKAVLAKRMREHFEKGGGAGDGGMEEMLGKKNTLLLTKLGPAAGGLLRAYAGMRDQFENSMMELNKLGGRIRAGLVGKVVGLLEEGGNINNMRNKKRNVNLNRVLKTLVQVHGMQMLITGVYNADPHPGNILVLPDGKLGLLDYGMVGRISKSDRETIAKTILALDKKDKKTTAAIYKENGYKATNSSGDIIDDNVLHRFATFHFDKIDLSPLTLEDGSSVNTLELLRSVREVSTPQWVEEGRRLGGLLQGVCAQAARPISLAKEWSPLAKQALGSKGDT